MSCLASAFGQRAETVTERLEHRLLERGQKGEPLVRNGAEHPPPVLLAAQAPDQFLGFEAVEQAGDARRVLDHPGGDLERRDGLRVGAAQNAQDVVLLGGDAVGFDGGRQTPLQLVARPQESDAGLLERRRERPSSVGSPAGSCSRASQGKYGSE